MWAEDLDSPPVPQGKELLVKFDENGEPEEACCLGILTLRAIKEGCEGVRIEKHDLEDGSVYAAVEYLDEEGVWTSGHDEQLPPPVAEWAETKSYEVEGDNGQPVTRYDTNPDLNGVRAITRNDDNGDSFADIAEAIRRDTAI